MSADAAPVAAPEAAAASQNRFSFMEQGGVVEVPSKKQPQNRQRQDVAKKLLSEFIGTFILIFASVATSIISKQPQSTFGIHGVAAGAALTVTLVIFATGHVSGAHINPAVTLAFATLRRFPWIQVPFYAGAQLMGSLSASFLLKGLFHEAPGILGGVTVPSSAGNLHALAFEIIISFIMMFVVTAIATDPHAVGDLAAIAVGVTVYVNNLLARFASGNHLLVVTFLPAFSLHLKLAEMTCSDVSGASMNPVRTIGPALAANEFKGLWVYFLGPIFGTQLGALAYSLIRSSNTSRS